MTSDAFRCTDATSRGNEKGIYCESPRMTLDPLSGTIRLRKLGDLELTTIILTLNRRLWDEVVRLFLI